MTARRPSRISGAIPVHGSRDEEYFRRLIHAFNEDRLEVEAPEGLQEAVNSQILRDAGRSADHMDTPTLHPALTNYGPVSAADFFRQARANQQPAARRSTAPRRDGIRPRSQMASRGHNGYLSNSCSASAWQQSHPRNSHDFSLFPKAEKQPMSQTPVALMEVGKPSRRTKEHPVGNDENQLPSRRKGTKRVRRTDARKGADEEEKLSPQPHQILYGAALLRNMRLSQAEGRNRRDSSEESLAGWEAQDRRKRAPSLETRSDVYESNTPLPANPARGLVQDWLRETATDIRPRHDVDTPSSLRLYCNTDDELLSTHDPSTGTQLPQAQAVGQRRSQPSPPPSSITAIRERDWRGRTSNTLLDTGDYDFETSDDDSANSRDDFALSHALMDLDRDVPDIPARNLSSSIGDYHTKDTKLDFLDYPRVPILFSGQEQQHLRPSKLMTEGDEVAAIRKNSFKHEQIVPTNALDYELDKGRMESTALLPALNSGATVVDMQKSSPLTESDRTERSLPKKDRLAVANIEYGPGPRQTWRQGRPVHQQKSTSCGWPDIPTEIYLEIAKYLSRDDALSLRSVCRDFSIAMMGAVFGSVVVPFGKAMYDTRPADWDRNPLPGSMFEKYGLAIRKFGISFEADTDMLADAQTKRISNEESSWWGIYNWPTPVYPRFNGLQALENLADNASLLKSAMAHLGKIHELGLSVDSGHGWLNGPDISDMALFDVRCGKGTRVFGKNLPAEDKQKQAIKAQIFEHAQARTLQECTEILRRYHRLFGPTELAFLRSVVVRTLESFRSMTRQPDFNAAADTGGAIPTPNAAASVFQHPPGGPQPANGIVAAGLQHFSAANSLQYHIPGPNHNNPPSSLHLAPDSVAVNHAGDFHNGVFPANVAPPVASATSPRKCGGQQQNACEGNGSQDVATGISKPAQKTQPQFPLIFNGYNVSAEVGGWCHLIQRRIAAPKSFPLQPGTLTEAQAQWLMETLWAQRAFLSAYTTSILANRACFAQVHSLHIAKISSGLLSSLEQRELWQGLPGLTTLTVLVSPDWRLEHITGDQTFNSNMLISPVDASLQLFDFLQTYIAPLEKLATLNIGFIGGGEHASGIMARNQHVLPAPISSAPRTWLSSHLTEPDLRTITTFNHIKYLTVQNAWFSPLMLEAFMVKSQDTSLRTLTLDSISLTATHGQRLAPPLTTASESLGPVHPPAMWLHESLPTTHCWPATIDRITPGATFVDRKYDAGMITDQYSNPRPPPSFRGFISRLVFKSCGYVSISGLSIQEFNQNDLIYPSSDPVDAGLKARASALAEKGVMLSDKNPNTGADWPLLGKLTQCIHPVEKRVLEQAWGMKFGWDSDLERWAAVEDGCFESGTGRFSGVIVGQGGKGIGAEG